MSGIMKVAVKLEQVYLNHRGKVIKKKTKGVLKTLYFKFGRGLQHLNSRVLVLFQ